MLELGPDDTEDDPSAPDDVAGPEPAGNGDV